jgi:LPXTG-site transpeptidase (sortase) family protein
VVGVALIWSSLGFVGYAAGWTVRKHHASTQLVDQVRTVQPSADPAAVPAAPCIQSPPQLGQLAGVLSIPALGLEAPVEEGTDDAELDVAAGHAPASVWPGTAGSSVLLAHDVSYFVHLGSLKPGDLITYRNQCSTVSFQVTGQQVVAAGSPVYNSTTPTLVLDTCWPTNALFYTSQRLLVSAAEVPNAPTPTATVPTGLRPVPRLSTGFRTVAPTTTLPPLTNPAASSVSYTTPAPPDLVAQGLTLTQNEAPMGTLTLGGDTSPGFEESPGPLSLTGASLEAYFGGIHASEQNRPDWWAAIAPGAAMPAPLVGGEITGHDAPLDVAIDSVGGTPATVTLSTEITVSGGPAPGEYDQAVTLGVAGTEVTIQAWGMTHV